MRKLDFYPKLACSNLWRNRSTYLPYLLACTIGIFTFYTLNAIVNSENLMALSNGSMTAYLMVYEVCMLGLVILGIFGFIMLLWTNSFLIKRRKKELALYLVLGMEKRNIATLLLFETLFVALLSFIAGLGGGVLLGQLLFLVLLRLVSFPVALNLEFSWGAVGATITLFGIIFLLMLLYNLRQVAKTNPVGLMAGAKQGEKEPRARFLITLVGLVLVGGGYYFANTVNNPGMALVLFMLEAIAVIIGTYLLFITGSIVVLKFLKKRKGYYYTPKHFISVSGMLYRMKQNAAGLASICILSCMVITTVAATVALYSGGPSAVENAYPYDYMVNFHEGERDVDVMDTVIQKLAADNGVELTEYHVYNDFYSYVAGNDGVYHSVDDSTRYENGESVYYFEYMTLDTYNRLTGNVLRLEDGQVLVHTRGTTYTLPTVTIDGVTYDVAQAEELYGRKNGVVYTGQEYTFILPSDEALAKHIELRFDAVEAGQYIPSVQEMYRQRNYHIYFNVAGSEAAQDAFYTDFTNYRTERSEELGHIGVQVKHVAAATWTAQQGGFLFLGIYFGILFLLAASMIIYYKQLSEGYEDSERFVILQKVGMSPDEVKRTINGQIRTVFFLPLGVALVHMAAAFKPVRLGLVIFDIVNPWVFVAALLATIAVYIIVYFFVYLRTAKTYFNLVKWDG